MLASTVGVRLVLWIGKTVPSPAPFEVMDSLLRVEVTNDDEEGDGFQLTFSLGKDEQMNYNLLQSGMLEPFTRVIIGVILGVTPEVLIDGVVAHHQVLPGNEPGTSKLIIMGRDVSQMLDLEQKNEKYENQPDSLIVEELIKAYRQYISVSIVTPTADVPINTERIPRQYETDLQFIKRLAKRNGFVFYIEPLTFDVNKAYWGPENRLGIPQPALTTNMGSWTNINSVRFSQDALSPVSTKGTFIEPITKISIPIPQLPSLRIPPLAAKSVEAKRKIILRDTANQNPAKAAANAVATVTGAPEAIKGEGELDTVRYGYVLRARRLIGFRGVGSSYSGDYYVSRVKHVIEIGNPQQSSTYKQEFKIGKEGTGALQLVVRT
ncbi:MAG TPA: hypothetical protein V6C97_05855 [Oculatellaceae cyanobacterium]